MIRYYNLIIPGEEGVQQLENWLERRVREESNHQPTLYLHPEAPRFEVLYLEKDEQEEEKSGEEGKQWLRKKKKKPAPVVIELVLEAMKEDYQILEGMFDHQKDVSPAPSVPVLTDAHIRDVRYVNDAILRFTTKTSHRKAVTNYKEMLEGLMQHRFQKLHYSFKVERDVEIDENPLINGDTLTGLVQGPVREVLDVYHVVERNGVAISLYDKDITFPRSLSPQGNGR